MRWSCWYSGGVSKRPCRADLVLFSARAAVHKLGRDVRQLVGVRQRPERRREGLDDTQTQEKRGQRWSGHLDVLRCVDA